MDKKALSEAFLALYELVVRLRGPDGCPWDARQTKESIVEYLLEEAYEVVEAVEQGDAAELCGELGDLLFQIVFLAYLAEEKKEFDLQEVIRQIQAKMIRRHPHVFGQAKVKNAQEVVENWAKIKESEKGAEASINSSSGEIPKNLPALFTSYRILKKIPKEDGKKTDQDLIELLEDKMLALRTISAQNPEQRATLIGEFLFHLADLAQRQGLNAEYLLRATNQRYLNNQRGLCSA